jgi:hypothetical protein
MSLMNIQRILPLHNIVKPANKCEKTMVPLLKKKESKINKENSVLLKV